MVLSDFCEKIKISRCRWPGYCSIAHFKDKCKFWTTKVCVTQTDQLFCVTYWNQLGTWYFIIIFCQFLMIFTILDINYKIFSLKIGFTMQFYYQNLSVLHHLFLKSGKKSKMSSTDGCAIFRWIIGAGLDQKKKSE